MPAATTLQTRRSLPPTSPMAILNHAPLDRTALDGASNATATATAGRSGFGASPPAAIVPHAPPSTESPAVPTAAAPPAGRILAIDDDPRLLQNFALALERDGYRVETADTLADGLRLAATRPFHVCLLDHNLGHESGIEALPRFAELAPRMRVVMVTANAGVDDAIKAIGLGAADYLLKPCSPDQLRIAVARQIDARRMLDRIDSLEREAAGSPGVELDSANPAMQAAIQTAMQVARTDANLLILGESGTGKGVFARAIHRASPRAGAEFVTVNCPSLSAELMESELFGHVRGSFTGAVQNSVGRIAHADGGTVFLDEIGDFPLALQPKLLRFIQDREYERVGDPATRKADVRIVAATNLDLEAMVREGRFRLDLLYRLNVIAITLPPLRERQEDLEALANAFIRRYAEAYRQPARRLSPAALARLRTYAWPGNVRELQNMMERATILCRGEEIGPDLLALGAAPKAEVQPGAPISLQELEKRHIERILAASDSLDAAARTLGIDASTLYRKRKLYGF